MGRVGLHSHRVGDVNAREEAGKCGGGVIVTTLTAQAAV